MLNSLLFFFTKFVSGQSRCFAFSRDFWKLLVSFWQCFARILVVIFMGCTSVWERTKIGITASVLQCGSSYIYSLSSLMPLGSVFWFQECWPFLCFDRLVYLSISHFHWVIQKYKLHFGSTLRFIVKLVNYAKSPYTSESLIQFLILWESLTIKSFCYFLTIILLPLWTIIWISDKGSWPIGWEPLPYTHSLLYTVFPYCQHPISQWCHHSTRKLTSCLSPRAHR